nr:integrase, catalytic region, zinc finger, CCHC-type, peptidase aspartic, catalytic [Tanacetum cinerariifolium]
GSTAETMTIVTTIIITNITKKRFNIFIASIDESYLIFLHVLMSSEYVDCLELSDISTSANDPMITGIVIWAGLLWIIAKVNMSSKYTMIINLLKKCGYKKDNCELNYKFLNNLQPEWKQYGTLMRQTKNLMDINIDALYNILKQNQGDVNDALGYKKKVVVITSDPLTLVAEKMNKITALLAKAFNRRKFYSKPTNNNLRTSSTSQSANKKQEFVKSNDKKEDKKADEKKGDTSKIKCYNCKKEGHFTKDCKKAKVKDYNYYKTKMLLAKKDSDEQVLLAEDQAWMESSSDSDQEVNANMVFMAQIEKVLSYSEKSSSSAEETIAEVSYYTSESESESEFETLEYYDNSTNYGLFVNNDDDQEIFHDAIESASENFIENHIDSQKDYNNSEVDHNDSEEKENLGDKLIRKFNHKIAKCQKRIEKANQQSKDFENQNKDLQEKYDVLINQIAYHEVLYDKMSVQLVELDKHVTDLKNTVLEKDLNISKFEECVRNKDLEIGKCLERLNVYGNKIYKMGQTNQTVHMVMPSKDNLYNGQKGIGFENPSYFRKAKDLRPTLYDEKVIGLGYTPMFLTHSDEALEIKKFKRSRENKIEIAYDYGNLNASYVNEKINFEDDYFQDIINLNFEKIDSPCQQTSSLKPYVLNVILEKIIIDLEDEVCVSPILMSKSSCDSKNVEIKLKRKRRKRKSSKQNVKQVDNDVSRANSDFVHFLDLDTFISVRRPKCSGVVWKKKGSSNTSKVDLSVVRISNLNKNVKRYSRNDLMNDLLDDNNFFIFDDESVKISPVSKMPFRKKPRDSMNVLSKSTMNKSLPRTMHKWLPKMQPLAQPIAKWFPRIIDSGCSKHMTGNHALLTNFVEKFLRTVHFGNNDFAVIAGYGDVVIGSMTINKVYYVEGLRHNLFSVGQFCDKGLEVAFRTSTCFVRNEDGVDLLTGDRSLNLYNIALNEVASNSSTCLLAKASSSQSWLWHQRLSHLNFATINNLVKNNLVQGLPKMKFEKDHLCSACERGKIHQKHHKRFDKTPYELINKRKPNIKFFRVFGCRSWITYEVVSLLEKEKANLKTIESLKSKGFESSENAISESKNQSENDCHMVEKEYDKVENPKVIVPGMFKLSVSQSVSPISILKTSCESNNVENTFSSVRRPKHSDVIWKKKGSSNTYNVNLSSEKSPDLLSHRGLKALQPSATCPMMIHGQKNPILDVLLFHFYPP